LIIMSRTVAVLSIVTLLLGCAADDRDAGDWAAAPADSRDTAATRAPAGEVRDVILFVGTSLTAGYGLGEAFAFPARIQERIDSAGLPFRVVNAGISGETSAGGVRRIDWMLQQPVSVLVLELGANDGLRALPVAQLRDNLDAILRRTQERYPEADLVILGMEAPPNLGMEYTAQFRQVYIDLARAYDATLLPFLLDGVAAEPALNLDDGIHPNEEGQRLLARNVWQLLAPLLERRAAARN
jgi:acyl-CoA thioesterase I